MQPVRDWGYLVGGVIALGAAAWVWSSRSSAPEPHTTEAPASEEWEQMLRDAANDPSTTGWLFADSPEPDGERILVFWDYGCGPCNEFGNLVDSIQAWRPNLRIEFLFLPISEAATSGFDAAAAALCAAEQGKLRTMHNRLVRLTPAAARDWQTIANQAEVPDLEAYADCLASDRPREGVERSAAIARDLYIPGVPTLVSSWGAMFAVPGKQTLAAFLAEAYVEKHSIGPRSLMRDSSGVLITDNRGTLGPVVLRAKAVPSVEISDLSGESPLFRVVGIVQLRDETIVVGNSGTGELLYLSPAGDVLAKAGGEGSGPGEFRLMGRIGHLGRDTIWAYEQRLRQLYRFGAHGELLSSITVPRPDDIFQPTPVGLFGDGSMPVYQEPFALADDGPARVERNTLAIYLYETGLQEFTPIVEVPGLEFSVSLQPAIAGRPKRFGRGLREFGRTTGLAVVEDLLVVADNDKYELAYYDKRGTLVRLVRRSHERVKIADRDIREVRARRLESVRNVSLREVVSRSFAEAPEPPQFLPAFDSRILSDDEGRVWVAEYPRPSTDSVRWSVFDRSGFLVATVITPARLQIMDVGIRWVIGVWRDQNGVEYVRKYQLE